MVGLNFAGALPRLSVRAVVISADVTGQIALSRPRKQDALSASPALCHSLLPTVTNRVSAEKGFLSVTPSIDKARWGSDGTKPATKAGYSYRL